MAEPFEHLAVPDLVGLEVGQARAVADSLDLFLTSGNPDGPPIGALTWPGRWVVTGQRPAAGVLVPRASWIVVDFEERGGGEAGDREPRDPIPPDRTTFVERPWSFEDVDGLTLLESQRLGEGIAKTVTGFPAPFGGPRGG